MKRITVILCVALLLAGLTFACGKDPAAVQLPTDPDDYWASLTTTEPLETESEADPEHPTDIDPLAPETYTSIVYLPVTTTKPNTTTLAVLSGNASTTTTKPATTTTKASTASTSTTTTTTTTKAGATQHYPGGLNITSQDAALSAFNAAVKRVVDNKAGFAKSHLITYKDWAFDQELLAGIPSFGGLFDPVSYISGPLNAALGKGIRSATASKGDSNSIIKNSAFTMGDLNSVTYTGTAGGDWIVTLHVKDGETRQQKRFLGSRATGNSPIDKGPLHQAVGDGNIYDHMDADKIFHLVKSSLSFINADPIDISETTTQVRFVARIDGQGRLLELKATYNQTINLKEIRILSGLDTYKDNTGSSTVTVTYDSFAY